MRSFTLSKLALWGLVLCTGALAVLGVLSLFGDAFRDFVIAAFAGMTGFALCVSQAAAACAQQLGRDTPWARGLAYLCAGVTGLVSVAGVYLGDAVLRGDHPELPPVWMMIVGGFAVGFVKPAMSFVIAACEGKERSQARSDDHVLAAKDQRIAELERELAAAKKTSQAKPMASPQRKPLKASGHAARTLANEIRKAEPVGASGRIADVEQELLDAYARDVTLQEIEAACRAIAERCDDEGAPLRPSLRLVANQIKVPRSRIDKCLIASGTKLSLVVERLGLAEAAPVDKAA